MSRRGIQTGPGQDSARWQRPASAPRPASDSARQRRRTGRGAQAGRRASASPRPSLHPSGNKDISWHTDRSGKEGITWLALATATGWPAGAFAALPQRLPSTSMCYWSGLQLRGARAAAHLSGAEKAAAGRRQQPFFHVLLSVPPEARKACSSLQLQLFAQQLARRLHVVLHHLLLQGGSSGPGGPHGAIIKHCQQCCSAAACGWRLHTVRGCLP